MHRLLYFFVILFFGFVSQPLTEKKFTVAFTPPKDLSVSRFYLDRVVQDKLVRDSANLQDGVVTFSGTVEQPLKARVVLFLTPKAGERPEVKFVEVLLEAAPIQVNAADGLDAIRYSGSKTQQEFTSYKNALAPVYKQMGEKWAGIYEAGKQADKAKENQLRKEATQFGEQAKKIQEDFMERNPRSVVTAFTLKDYVGPVWENLEKAEQIYARLDPALKTLPDMVIFAKGFFIATTMAKGKPYPDFTLPDSTGKMISVSSLKGKYVFVDFWASWCTPCRAESPALVAAYQKYQRKGFEILSVSFDENTKSWLKAVAKDGYTWANVVDTTGMGPKGNLSTRLEIKAIPRNFLLDKEGKVVATNLRGEALEQKLHEVFGE